MIESWHRYGQKEGRILIADGADQKRLQDHVHTSNLI